MDSGNSGSFQSSSGDDGGVATATTITTTGSIDSMYLNTSTYFNPIPNLQPHHHHQQQQPPSTFFNPTSFSQPVTQNSNPMYNLDSLWSRNPNSDPFSNLDHSHQDPIFHPNPENPLQNSQNPETAPAKNPKKRTRASRRAPTTVLTTDTTNFRQMVQEFTGIPAAPFATSSSSSPFSLRRDLLRPSAQKIQLHQSQPSYLNTNSTSTSNFNLTPSEVHNSTNQPLNLSSLSNLQNLQNQMFPFQGTLSQTVVSRQGDGTEGENLRSEVQNVGLGSNLKRWRGENENVGNFEGVNRNIQNIGVGSSRSDGDQNQLPGNEDSWICPSD